ncbi:MAG TPA: biotin/lipoyl-containing protein, partial [Phycisphaerales bacterium]|nr:biotin/lipoyl-containing protein [Phycisphaerales bacterium]
MATKQPDDRSYFILPDLGEGVAEAELVKWRVAAGDTVEEHQTLAEMETDKALVEVPSPWSGTISELHGNVGDIILVGKKLVSYGQAVTSTPKPIHAPDPVAATQATSEDAGTVVGNVSETLSVPAGFQRSPVTTTTTTAASKALATPAVRRIARDLKVDINRVPATGRGGRVKASDVQAHASPAEVIAQPAAVLQPAAETIDMPIATRVTTPIEG